LKGKLGSIISDAEASIAEAQYAHDDMQKSFTAEVEVLLERNAVLEEENESLRSLLAQSSSDVDTERGLLLRSVRIIERLRLRGKDLSRNVDRKALIHDLRRRNALLTGPPSARANNGKNEVNAAKRRLTVTIPG
jgi:hypothetical protein